MKVIVLGIGYVGSTMTACLTKAGHRVIGIDKDPSKVAALAAGSSPVREPGVQALLAAALDRALLSSTAEIGDHALDADLAVICVGTPSGSDGLLDTSHLRDVAEELGAAVRCRSKGAVPLLCVYRSTMLPGTMEGLVVPRMSAAAGEPPGIRYEVALNPEFLRETAAVSDYFKPAKIVIGERQQGITQTALRPLRWDRCSYVRGTVPGRGADQDGGQQLPRAQGGLCK